jgi:nucleoside-diphosphate-sugar epimerase
LGDIMDGKALRAIFADVAPDAVVHLAARTDLTGREVGEYAVNFIGVKNVIDAITSVSTVERSIFASTRLVADLGYEQKGDRDYHASTPYGESKARAEELVRSAAGIGTWTIVRPTGIWGPWFGTFREFFRTIERGWYVHPGHTNVLKSFGFVGNTVYQIQRLVLADRSDVDRQTFWLADYSPLVVSEWADRIRKAFGGPPIGTAPLFALRAAARVGDVLLSSRLLRPPLTSARLRNMIEQMVYPTEELERVVGPLPHSLDDGIQLTVEWLRHQRGAIDGQPSSISSG